MNHDDDAELERLELLEACMRIGLSGSTQRELEADPARALAIIEYAERQQALKSIAGFAVARFRAGYDPRSSPSSSSSKSSVREREPEPVEAPPTLSAIEYAWSLDRSPSLESVLRMMGVAIGRSPDGFEGVLRRGWFERERYDDEGSRVSVDRG
jgi:hypothetical protein